MYVLSAVWNAGCHFLNSPHLCHGKHSDNKVHSCLAEEQLLVENTAAIPQVCFYRKHQVLFKWLLTYMASVIITGVVKILQMVFL